MIITSLLLAAGTVVARPDTVIRLPRDGAVLIETIFRNVVLATKDDDRVTVEGAEARLSGRRLVIESTDPSRTGGRNVEVRVTVPAWAAVSIHAVNGDVDTRGGSATLRIEAPQGNVSARDFSGTSLEVSAVNGQVSVHAFSGAAARIESVNGDVTVGGSGTGIRVLSVNGDISLQQITFRDVNVENVNGRIDWHGNVDRMGRYRFQSHNGEIGLHLPRTVQARLRVSTMSGDFRSAIPGVTTGESGSSGSRPFEARSFSYTWGGGGAIIDIDTFNGDIRVLESGGP